MTEKLYPRDPYLQEASAGVSRRESRDSRWSIRLERTVFCTAGGGRPQDLKILFNRL